MKKILLLAVLSIIIIPACKKQQNNPSIVVTASFPTITLSAKYYSIPVGGLHPTVQATAYDSFYHESCKIVTIDSGINSFVAGFYTGYITAKNLYGFVSYDTYYVAVTNISGALDISGTYTTPSNDSITTVVSRLATGFYSTSNYSAVNSITNASAATSALFVITSGTTIVFNDGTPGILGLIPVLDDTTFSYNTAAGSVTFAK